MLYWVTGTIGSSFRLYRDWALGMADRPETWQGRDRDWVPTGVEPRPPARGGTDQGAHRGGTVPGALAKGVGRASLR